MINKKRYLAFLLLLLTLQVDSFSWRRLPEMVQHTFTSSIHKLARQLAEGAKYIPLKNNKILGTLFVMGSSLVIISCVLLAKRFLAKRLLAKRMVPRRVEEQREAASVPPPPPPMPNHFTTHSVVSPESSVAPPLPPVISTPRLSSPRAPSLIEEVQQGVALRHVGEINSACSHHDESQCALMEEIRRRGARREQINVQAVEERIAEQRAANRYELPAVLRDIEERGQRVRERLSAIECAEQERQRRIVQYEQVAAREQIAAQEQIQNQDRQAQLRRALNQASPLDWSGTMRVRARQFLALFSDGPDVSDDSSNDS